MSDPVPEVTSRVKASTTYHVLDPLISLALWVNEEWPTTRELHDHTVLDAQIVLGQTSNLPATNFDRFA